MSDSYDKIDVNHSENIIINIKPSNLESDNDILPGYTQELCNTSTCTSCNTCWNCCHDFTGHSHSIPLSYMNGVFHIYGYFCSFNCGARYIFDNYNDKNKWNLYSLLNLYYNISQNTIGKIVTIAPNKLVLKKFGGSMSIDEYRGTVCRYELIIPPIIPHNHMISMLGDSKISTKNKENFKLYRKKPLNTKNNIYNTMNLS
jgi:hypothetical protein